MADQSNQHENSRQWLRSNARTGFRDRFLLRAGFVCLVSVTIGLVLLLVQTGNVQANEVILGVKVEAASLPGEVPQGARIIIEHTGKSNFAIISLTRPWRFHVDFQDVVLTRSAYSVASNPIVLDVRYGRLTVTSVRIVFALTRPARIVRTETVDRGGGVHALLIDLEPEQADNFIQSTRLRPLLAGLSTPKRPEKPARKPPVRQTQAPIRLIDGGEQAVMPAGQSLRLDEILPKPQAQTQAKTKGRAKAGKNAPISSITIATPKGTSRNGNARKHKKITISSLSLRQIANARRSGTAGNEGESAGKTASLPREAEHGWRQLAYRLPKRGAGGAGRVAPMVIIDAGHGGVDPGAISPGGLREKDVTLDMAQRLAKALRSSGQFIVRMTRPRDKFVSLRDRIARARAFLGNRNGTWALFISLHADSVKKGRFNGTSIYTLSEKASDEEAAMLAQQENAVDLIAGVNVPENSNPLTREILIDLAQGDTMAHSLEIARTLANVIRDSKVRMLPRPLRSAGFAVLKAPDIPSILFEMGFLSSVSDEKRLRSDKYREKLVELLSSAVTRYFFARAQASR